MFTLQTYGLYYGLYAVRIRVLSHFLFDSAV